MAKSATRSEQESYRLWFFIIAQLIMVSMVWLVFQETYTRRPWKDHQLRWFETEATRAALNLAGEQDWLKTGTLKKTVEGQEVEIKLGERIPELQKTIAELEGAIIDSPARVEFEKLKADLAAAEVKLKDQEMILAFAKADEDELYYYYRNAKHHDDAAGEAKFQAKVEAARKAVGDASNAYDAASAARDTLSDKVAEIQSKIATAKREIAEYSDGVAAAQRAVDAGKVRFTGVEALISGDGRIEQFWNPQIDLVDRCHTCHMGFDKCGYAKPEEIVAKIVKSSLTEAQAKKAFCLTRAEASRYVAAATKIKDSWGSDDEVTFDEIKGELKLEEDPVLAAAAKLGVDAKEAEYLFRTHPKEAELIRTHPPQVFGCTTCHYGQGRQTKGVGLNYLTGNTAPFDHARKDHYWQLQILENSKGHTESSCFNCHKQDYELPNADKLTEGRKLAQHLGCNGCHPMGVVDSERKHGPTLRKVAGKMDSAWMLSWIQNPRGHRPRTRMPNLWPTALGKDGKVDPTINTCETFEYAKGNPYAPARYGNCADVREEESSYIMAYLLKHSTTDNYASMPASASAERGKQVFEDVGCQGCHNLGDWTQASTLPGSKDRDLAPNLSNLGDKIANVGWVYEWVKNPKKYWHETRMPNLRLTDAEAWDLAAYLTSLKSDAKPELSDKAKAFLAEEGADEKGKKLIAYYGCFGCHEIEGFDTTPRVAVDLTEFGSKPPSKLDFGDVPEFVADTHAQTWENWTRRKLHEPRVYRYERAATRMAQYDLTQAEQDALIIFLKGQNDVTKQWPAAVKHNLTAEKAAVQRGALLVDYYNCRGCHMIDDRGIDVDGDRIPDGGDIFRLYADNEDEKFRAPPKLINQGAKVYPDWLYKFLKHPFKLRENYKLRMPTFEFTDKEAGDLVAYFAAKARTPYPFVEKKFDALSEADKVTAKQLFTEGQCLNCHNLGGGAPIDPKNVAPNLLLTAERLQYDWLFHWLKDPQAQAPGVGMPGFFIPIDDKPGEYETPLTDLANGDWRRQIELLRAYVIDLGRAEQVGAVAQAAKKK